jgi:hypothetical protein
MKTNAIARHPDGAMTLSKNRFKVTAIIDAMPIAFTAAS